MGTDTNSTIESRVGTTLAGKYQLTRLLGAGGMGAVYDATNTWTQRRVAVKLLLDGATHDQELAARFLREARAASRIQHPSVVDILDMGQDADGSLFIVQELLSGTDLRHVLDQRGALPPKEAIEIVTPIMAALVAAHARGVVHRDLKPENVFLAKTTSGLVPKLIDFGIARLTEPGEANLTRTGSAIGTPIYMSPEQAKGESNVDAQTDVWAIGVLLFECLSGCVPFEGPNYNAVIAAIMLGPIVRLDIVAPSVPKEIADVVARALTRDRSKRYRSMQAFLGDLLECPTYQAETWHQSLRSTHRTALEPQRETVDEDLLATPRLPQRQAPSGNFSEGQSWMANDLNATTLGRTAREVPKAAPSTSTRSWVAGVGTLAVVSAAVIIFAYGIGRHLGARSEATARRDSTASTSAPPTTRTPVPAEPPSATRAVPTVGDPRAASSADRDAGGHAHALSTTAPVHRVAAPVPTNPGGAIAPAVARPHPVGRNAAPIIEQ